MVKVRMVLTFAAALGFIACGGPTTVGIDHTLTPTPPAPKPSADCTDSDVAVFQILAKANPAGFNTTHTVVLNDDVTCAVHIYINPVTGQTPAAVVSGVASAYQAVASFYAFNMLNKSYIPLWYDYPPSTAATVPTDADCAYAQTVVATAFPNAKATVVTNPRNPHLPTRCYVQAVFPDETSFKNFLDYTYPANSGQSDSLHVYHQISESVVHPISVFGTAPVPAQN